MEANGTSCTTVVIQSSHVVPSDPKNLIMTLTIAYLEEESGTTPASNLECQKIPLEVKVNTDTGNCTMEGSRNPYDHPKNNLDLLKEGLGLQFNVFCLNRNSTIAASFFWKTYVPHDELKRQCKIWEKARKSNKSCNLPCAPLQLHGCCPHYPHEKTTGKLELVLDEKKTIKAACLYTTIEVIQYWLKQQAL